MSATDARPLRADARRNRDRLLDAAVRAFSRDPPDVTLDAIAKDAGVGIGTLYRHFPTREALIEAAYRNELARLCDAVAELLPYAQSRDRLIAAITTLLRAAAAAGAIRPDIEPADVLAGLSGVSLAAGEPTQRDQARRLLDLLMDGLRYGSVRSR